ncbi:hypothetical protein HOB87_11345 [Candidatus Woesearchaeota archaeon]|nr:hypothetical protein [Bacteroidota bacterium]MBT4732546.1 hypothetical protein [Candidatus Woesearchaeota archaeon]MBT6229060.1 hypothetical protein [Candidatus Scalindua sp.]MBT6565156.1 hypothetical protein [Candidatus Scalindua sp.]
MRKITNNTICGKTKDQLIEECSILYKQNGFPGISFKNLKEVNNLYYRLYRFGIDQKTLIHLLGIKEEYKIYRKKSFKRRVNGKTQYAWTWERIIKEARVVVKQKGFLPPGEWFHKNGLGSLVQAVYGHDKTWNDLRSEFASYTGSSFVESRSGIRWRSHPEASLSNFFYARGIKHELGQKYPDDFARFAQQNYGYYDLTFLDNKNRWIDVEVWGDKPLGHDEKRYAEKRKLKEKYNLTNDHFLGIQYQDCYDEGRLTDILKIYIGVIEPYIFDKLTDKIIQSTHWSNTDELIEYCREIANDCPDGKFPTEEWLRKRGKWKDRSGVAYNTLSIYIKTWIGGIRNLRRIIGQEGNSTITWDKEKTLYEFNKWYAEYGYTPSAAAQRFLRGQINISKEEYNRAARINAAIHKYIGSALQACKILGIKPSRNKSSRFYLND